MREGERVVDWSRHQSIVRPFDSVQAILHLRRLSNCTAASPLVAHCRAGGRSPLLWLSPVILHCFSAFGATRGCPIHLLRDAVLDQLMWETSIEPWATVMVKNICYWHERK